MSQQSILLDRLHFLAGLETLTQEEVFANIDRAQKYVNSWGLEIAKKANETSGSLSAESSLHKSGSLWADGIQVVEAPNKSESRLLEKLSNGEFRKAFDLYQNQAIHDDSIKGPESFIDDAARVMFLVNTPQEMQQVVDTIQDDCGSGISSVWMGGFELRPAGYAFNKSVIGVPLSKIDPETEDSSKRFPAEIQIISSYRYHAKQAVGDAMYRITRNQKMDAELSKALEPALRQINLLVLAAEYLENPEWLPLYKQAFENSGLGSVEMDDQGRITASYNDTDGVKKYEINPKEIGLLKGNNIRQNFIRVLNKPQMPWNTALKNAEKGGASLVSVKSKKNVDFWIPDIEPDRPPIDLSKQIGKVIEDQKPDPEYGYILCRTDLKLALELYITDNNIQYEEAEQLRKTQLYKLSGCNSQAVFNERMILAQDLISLNKEQETHRGRVAFVSESRELLSKAAEQVEGILTHLENPDMTIYENLFPITNQHYGAIKFQDTNNRTIIIGNAKLEENLPDLARHMNTNPCLTHYRKARDDSNIPIFIPIPNYIVPFDVSKLTGVKSCVLMNAIDYGFSIVSDANKQPHLLISDAVFTMVESTNKGEEFKEFLNICSSHVAGIHRIKSKEPSSLPVSNIELGNSVLFSSSISPESAKELELILGKKIIIGNSTLKECLNAGYPGFACNIIKLENGKELPRKGTLSLLQQIRADAPRNNLSWPINEESAALLREVQRIYSLQRSS